MGGGGYDIKKLPVLVTTPSSLPGAIPYVVGDVRDPDSVGPTLIHGIRKRYFSLPGLTRTLVVLEVVGLSVLHFFLLFAVV